MKKRLIAGFLLLVMVFTMILPASSSVASQTTSYTYTLDNKGYLVRTQDAYLPDKTITDLGLANPDDLFVDDDNMLYIADSGNARIVKYSIDTAKIVNILEYAEFTKPTGIFVTKKGDLYVADPAARMIFRFDKDFNFIESFARPDTPIFSDTNFQPMRISVGNNGDMYIVGEGVYSGIIQLSAEGDFLGYFTVNKTKLTLVQAFQNAIFTREQLANLTERTPTTFSNIFIDKSNIVYTTTMGTNEDGLKKHDTAGGNMFIDQDPCFINMTDLWVDEQGIIYTSCSSGYINIYSSAGEWIFNFGSSNSDLDVSGLYTTLPSITVDRSGTIWTVDGDKGYLQSFEPTEYANMIYEAMTLYEKGLYQESQEKWSEVLRLNQMSVLAHNGVGKAYLHAEDYESAIPHFEVAGNRTYYSQAFWEVRNGYIQRGLPVVAIIILVLTAIGMIVGRLDKEHKVRKFKKKVSGKIAEIPVLGDLQYAFKIATHPVDRYYDIRIRKKGSVLGATVIYLLMFLSFMLYQTKKGFIYQTVAVEDMDINAIVIGFFAIIGLFILCNYLVASIKDGDGSFKQVYMIPAFGCMPAMIALLMVTVMSHGLTANEAFMLDVVMNAGIIWSLILIFVGLMTVHDYTVKETIVSLIITLVFIIIIAVVSIVIIIMWDQLWGFLKTVGEEMAHNVVH